MSLARPSNACPTHVGRGKGSEGISGRPGVLGETESLAVAFILGVVGGVGGVATRRRGAPGEEG